MLFAAKRFNMLSLMSQSELVCRRKGGGFSQPQPTVETTTINRDLQILTCPAFSACCKSRRDRYLIQSLCNDEYSGG